MVWRRSSFSGNASNCVELRRDLQAVRDSKAPTASLAVSREAVRRLLAQLQSV